MYAESNFEQAQINEIDFHLRCYAVGAGIAPESVTLADRNGHPAWRVGSREALAIRPTTKQATLFVTDQGVSTGSPRVGVAQDLRWPAARIFRALFSEASSDPSSRIAIRDRGAYIEHLAREHVLVVVKFHNRVTLVGIIEVEGDSVSAGAFIRSLDGRRYKFDLDQVADVRIKYEG